MSGLHLFTILMTKGPTFRHYLESMATYFTTPLIATQALLNLKGNTGPSNVKNLLPFSIVMPAVPQSNLQMLQVSAGQNAK